MPKDLKPIYQHHENLLQKEPKDWHKRAIEAENVVSAALSVREADLSLKPASDKVAVVGYEMLGVGLDRERS